MKLESHLFLVGFMGSGKSTVGSLLAERLGVPFVDLDQVVEWRTGKAIAQIFAEQGEEVFRDAESDALESTGAMPPSVVACGGGVILRPDNRCYLCSHGVVAYLTVTAGEAIARIGDAASRPLLAGPGAALAATSLLAARESLYESVADIRIDTSGLSTDRVAAKVLEELENRKS